VLHRSARPIAFILVFSFLILLKYDATQGQTPTPLATLAASLQPGQWSQLTTIGMSDSLMRIGSGHLLQYSDSATWDPTSRRFMFIGGAHAPAPNQRFLIYTDSNNTWQEQPPQSWFCQPSPAECVHHPYDHHTLNPATGDMFYFDRGTKNIFRYSTSLGSWDPNAIAIPFQTTGELGIAYFPERGGIVLANGWGVYFWKESTKQWSNLGTFQMGNIHNFAEYSNVQKTVLFGGGQFDAGGYSSDIYKMDANGTITKLHNSPIPLSIPRTTITVDPVTGAYLVFAKDGNDVFQFYKYDVGTDSWQAQPNSNPISTNSDQNTGLMAAPVSTYGVTMFLKYNYGDPRVYIYKNGSSSQPPPASDSQAPSIPTALSATAVSSSQIDLTWTASTDDTGVAGYRIYRCIGTGCTANPIATATTTTYSDSMLSPSTTYEYHVAAYDAAGNVSGQSAPASATTQAAPAPGPGPTPSGNVGGYAMPSLEDERNTYRLWGWTWTAKEEPGAVTEPISGYSVANPDIHGDTEGDDLWSYLQMYRRTGNQVYLNRARAWATYFKNGYRSCSGGQFENFCYDRDAFGLDHLYGWGLLASFEDSADATTVPEAENIAAVLESLYGPNSPYGCLPAGACTWYGVRQSGRHLLFMTRLAEITGNTRWVTLRDRIIDLLLNSQDWDQARGMYFFGEASTDANLGNGAYKSGDRIASPFQIGVLAEAFFQAYRTTGRQELKNRLIAMARFVAQYGLDPTYQYSGSVFGIVDGQMWHNYSASQPVTFWDPVYTTSVVNLLVMGYKFTGDTALLNRAKIHFNRGTKGVSGSPTQRSAPDNVVHHFVDTVFDGYYLGYNKGELQYTYLIFEKGGSPIVDGTTPPPPPPADTTSPTITNVSASQITSSSATISWTTDEPSDSQVEYGVSTAYGSQTTLNTSSVTSHSQALSGLSAGTTYQYRVKSKDAAGNPAVSPNFTFTTTTGGAAPPPNGSSGYWTFDETSGDALDSSGNNINGKLLNGATRGPGKVGSALVLDGIDDYVNMGNPSALQVTGSLTISAWINSSAFPGDDAVIVSKRDSGSTGYQLDTTIDQGPRTIGFKLTNSSGGKMYRYGATQLQANTWYYVTGVYDASAQTLSVYLNGQPDNGPTVGTVTASQNNSTQNVNVGRRPGLSGFAFKGKIDELRIYNRALSAAEIQAAMNGSTPSDTAPPAVRITAPTSGSIVIGKTVTVSATASDNVGVVGVQFQLDGARLGNEVTTAPYSTTWDSTTSSIGTHVLTAVARDAAGNKTTSQPVTIIVADGVPPTVTIIQPVAASTVSGATTLLAAAADNVGVAGVQFQLDGNNLGAELPSSPYTTTWNIGPTPAGAHILTAIARDAAGNRTTSPPTNVTVLDITAPSISLSYISGTRTLSATAIDDGGLAGVQFQLDGANFGNEVTSAPYTVRLDTNAVMEGSHTVAGVARDTAGNRTASPAIAILIDSGPPSISVTAPANGSVLSGAVTIAASASDNIGLVGIQFLLDGTPLGTEISSAPYSMDWDTRSVPAGNHVLAAIARDSVGNSTVSMSISVTVVSSVATNSPEPPLSSGRRRVWTSSVLA
jgi:hypothetical protein